METGISSGLMDHLARMQTLPSNPNKGQETKEFNFYLNLILITKYSTPKIYLNSFENIDISLSCPWFIRLMSVIMKNRLVYGRRSKCIGQVCISDEKLNLHHTYLTGG